MKTIEVTTKIGCSNKCVYCPQDVLLKVYKGNKKLSFNQFSCLIGNIPLDVAIDFTGFCEPFLNSQASRMMRYSIEMGYKTLLITTLTGFTKEDADILKDVTFEHLWVHQYEGLKRKDAFNERLEMVSKLKTKSFKVFQLGERYSRAGNLWETNKRTGKLSCLWDDKFTRNVVLPNGNVYLCCMDYGLRHLLGNLFYDSYSNLLRQDILNMANTDDSDLICRHCEIAKYEN